MKSELTQKALKDAVANIAAFKRLKRPVNKHLGGEIFVNEPQNPALGFLVAHEWGEDLTPKEVGFEDTFARIVTSVPFGEQIDLYCVIAGEAGCRGRIEKDGRPVLCGPGENFPIWHWDLGEGALAWFVLVLMTVLQNLVLGQGDLLPYLRLLQKPSTSGT